MLMLLGHFSRKIESLDRFAWKFDAARKKLMWAIEEKFDGSMIDRLRDTLNEYETALDGAYARAYGEVKVAIAKYNEDIAADARAESFVTQRKRRRADGEEERVVPRKKSYVRILEGRHRDEECFVLGVDGDDLIVRDPQQKMFALPMELCDEMRGNHPSDI